MNINEIIDKPVLHQDEILFLIGEYIKEKKGVNVKPVINVNPLIIINEVRLMLEALPYAIAHFKQKKS